MSKTIEEGQQVARKDDAATKTPRPEVKTINLALQGGGAHGAFTWGVLDELLGDDRLDFEAISGTSAGAMNAVVLADGLMRDGAVGAQRRLAAFWRRISREGMAGGTAGEIFQNILGFWNLPAFPSFPTFPSFDYTHRLSQMVSPYRINPLNINPLRDLLDRLVDFDLVRANTALKLFISATNVRDGKIKVFTDDEVTADAVMASACLPYLFQAVEIGGEHYWDGGYMGNPALFPFFTETECSDILLVQVNPVRSEAVPKTAKEIMERVSEITFNSSLLREFRAIDFVNRLLDENRIDPARYRRNRVHRIDATEALSRHSASSKLDTSWRFFKELHEAGREAARAWLDAHFDDIGVRSSLDLRAEFM
ncbi:patatin-like phospholipase family protein [Bauldia litoralis]|uniref:NTE family protein n=1 Tax=Bauldia litoralis TaxID=665467 RepID=A0A1G6BZQ3_9HYPH|nr:patatin-like phospholipase family protein [Bauldia litoralis]SDB26082.1 NTE family protein [Bauldia litoralis]